MSRTSIIPKWFILISVICFSTVSARKNTAKSKNLNKEDVIGNLPNDAYLDLTEDEEYEDLRAELLALQRTVPRMGEHRRQNGKSSCCQDGGQCIERWLCPRKRVTNAVRCKNPDYVCCALDVPYCRANPLAQVPWYAQEALKTDSKEQSDKLLRDIHVMLNNLT